ncbi:MAG: hypothetical protein HZB23_07920 [Deltaproteobacteria bacterium]|nr:hypothetical protein [Deltaproteobacteria bacterium]
MARAELYLVQSSKGRQGVRQISAVNDEKRLALDLAEMRNLALSMGADDAAILGPDDIVLDPDSSGGADAVKTYTSAHWPIGYPNDSVADAVRAFSSAVFFRLKTPADMPDHGQGLITEPGYRKLYEKLNFITTQVESSAFYKGYQLTLGFGAGNCRAIYCHKEKRCMAVIKGRTCRHPYKARPSAIAMGLDVESMAKALGWEFWNEETGPLLAGIIFVD